MGRLACLVQSVKMIYRNNKPCKWLKNIQQLVFCGEIKVVFLKYWIQTFGWMSAGVRERERERERESERERGRELELEFIG